MLFPSLPPYRILRFHFNVEPDLKDEPQMVRHARLELSGRVCSLCRIRTLRTKRAASM